MGVEGWKETEEGPTAGVGVQSEGLSFQGNWKVCERDKFRGKRDNFRYEYSSLNPLLRYSRCASKK